MTAISGWAPAEATRRIRAYVASDAFELSLTLHARARMAERGLLVGDLLHLLGGGFVYREGEAARRPGWFR